LDQSGEPVREAQDLETAKESYLRLGFKVVREWDVSKGGPHFWSMLNEHLKMVPMKYW